MAVKGKGRPRSGVSAKKRKFKSPTPLCEKEREESVRFVRRAADGAWGDHADDGRGAAGGGALRGRGDIVRRETKQGRKTGHLRRLTRDGTGAAEMCGAVGDNK